MSGRCVLQNGQVSDDQDLVQKAEQLLAHTLTERQFLGWVHAHVGHSGPDELQDLVEMDDFYELGGTAAADEWFDASPEAADARKYVRPAAR